MQSEAETFPSCHLSNVVSITFTVPETQHRISKVSTKTEDDTGGTESALFWRVGCI